MCSLKLTINHTVFIELTIIAQDIQTSEGLTLFIVTITIITSDIWTSVSLTEVIENHFNCPNIPYRS